MKDSHALYNWIGNVQAKGSKHFLSHSKWWLLMLSRPLCSTASFFMLFVLFFNLF